MKIKVRSLATGKKITPPTGKEYILSFKGEVFVINDIGQVESRLPTLAGYSLEVAFQRDTNGKWIWEHSVVHD